MRKTDRPRPPAAIRVALTLVSVVILSRLWLLQAAVRERLSDLEGVAPPTEGASVQEMLNWGSGFSSAPLVPGGFGSPVLLLLILPLMIVARRLTRRGYGPAAIALMGFFGVRCLMILFRGPWDGAALFLLSLMMLTIFMLALPTSRDWFESSARSRAGLA